MWGGAWRGHLPTLVRDLMAEFAFATGPTAFANAETQLEFTHGVVDGAAIQKLGIYNDGIVVNAASPTDVLDGVIDYLFAWTTKKYGVTLIETHAFKKLYESNVVVKASPSFLAVNKKLQRLQKELQASLKVSSGVDEPFEIAALSISLDLQTMRGMKPAPFRVVRHATADFSSNLYQSTAPLPTDSHLRMLKLLDDVTS